MKARLFLAAFVSFCSLLVCQTAIPPVAGTGAEDDPYQISSLGNLYWIQSNTANWNKHYIQTADIAAAETILWNDGSGWEPIGYSVGHSTIPFTGSYDGQGYVISNLYSHSPSSDNSGLFGYADAAVLHDIHLEGIHINAMSPAGGLVGDLIACDLSDCSVTGEVSGNRSIGGMVGLCCRSSVSNCTADVTVEGVFNVGGLIGYLQHESTLAASESVGEVIGCVYTGGLVGRVETESSISDCSCSCSISGTSYTGGFAGLLSYSSTVNGCKCTTEIDALDYTGGFIGCMMYSASVTNCHCTVDAICLGCPGYTFVSCGGFVGLMEIYCDISDCTCAGEIYTTIPNTGGFIGMCKQQCDITSSHSSCDVVSRCALYGCSGVGGFVAHSVYCEFQFCSSSGEVSGVLENTGGFAGIADNSIIRHCYSSSDVESKENVGGFAGLLEGYSHIYCCYSYGYVKGDEPRGGFIAQREDGTSVTGSYWDMDASEHSLSAGGQGRTTAQMTNPPYENTYLGWDFRNAWIDDVENVNNGYPVFRKSPVSVDDEESPAVCAVLTAYPNPFNPTTTIAFSLPQPARVSLDVYNVRGQHVRTLRSEPLSAEEHAVVWNGRDDQGAPAASGVYFVRLSYGGQSIAHKLMLLK